ncbi:hypothetical protein B0H19DRAFT_1266802 [Mycena capillaripes]|nr:hypothetical protein B0H19DRAFT_1266802 [Mycena capillaripes]
MPSALLLLADGTEEIYFALTAITYDTLVRVGAGVACGSAYITVSTENGVTDWSIPLQTRSSTRMRGTLFFPQVVSF